VSITETVLVFVGIPVGGFLLLAAAVFGPSAARQPRYRPGRAWDHQPVWFLPAPDGHGPTHSTGDAGLTAIESGQPRTVVAAGGATGEW
jgi:hypothetical protein